MEPDGSTFRDISESVPVDPRVRSIGSEEIARRIQEVDEGLVELIPVDAVLCESRQRAEAIRRARADCDNQNDKDKPE